MSLKENKWIAVYSYGGILYSQEQKWQGLQVSSGMDCSNMTLSGEKSTLQKDAQL